MLTLRAGCGAWIEFIKAPSRGSCRLQTLAIMKATVLSRRQRQAAADAEKNEQTERVALITRAAHAIDQQQDGVTRCSAAQAFVDTFLAEITRLQGHSTDSTDPLAGPLQEMFSATDRALCTTYTIDSPTLIASVMALWSNLTAWLLHLPTSPPHDHANQQQQANHPTLDVQPTATLDDLLDHLVQHRVLVAPLVTLLGSFVRITGVNPLLGLSCGRCLALLTFLVVSAGEPGTECEPAAGPGSSAQQALQCDANVKAAACLLEAMAQGPMQELLQAEQLHQRRAAASGTGQATAALPPPLATPAELGATTSQPLPGSTAAAPKSAAAAGYTAAAAAAAGTADISRSAQSVPWDDNSTEHTPYPLQCYRLMTWLLQRPALDDLDWHQATHGKLAFEVLAECFTCFGGSAQLFSRCLMSSLAGLTHVAHRDRPRAGRQKRGTKSKAAGAGKRVKLLVDEEEEGKGEEGAARVAMDTMQGEASELQRLLPGHPYEALNDWLCGCGAERVLGMLCHAPDMPVLVSALMAGSGGSHDKDMGGAVLHLVRLMYGADPTALIQVCVELLRPEANCSVDVRLKAMGLMQAAASDAWLSAPSHDQPVTKDASVPGCGATTTTTTTPWTPWTPYAVDVVIFSLMHDPSHKVRRSGMRLLSSMCTSHDSKGPVAAVVVVDPKVVSCTLTKLHDKDVEVQGLALRLLLELPPHLVVATLDSHGSLAQRVWLMRKALTLLVDKPAEVRRAKGPIKALLKTLLGPPGNTTPSSGLVASGPPAPSPAGGGPLVGPQVQLMSLSGGRVTRRHC